MSKWLNRAVIHHAERGARATGQKGGQLHGHGIDFGASAAWGAGVNVGIEFGIGAENSTGKQVWAAHGGIEYGAEAEISIGYNFTGGGGMIKDAIGDLFS